MFDLAYRVVFLQNMQAREQNIVPVIMTQCTKAQFICKFWSWNTRQQKEGEVLNAFLLNIPCST